MEIRKILVGTDFSRPSEIAVDRAANLAAFLEAEILLVHAGSVTERARDLPSEGVGAAPELDRLARETLSADRSRLEALAREVAGRGLTVSAHVVDAYPDVGLCDAARDLGADLIVCGTQGRTGLQRFLLGSVAERVVRAAECPVMVARDHGHDGTGGFRRIMVPTDFSPIAGRALELALALAGEGARIEIYHCWQLPGPGLGREIEPILADLEREVEARGRKLLEAYEEARAAAGARLEFFTTRDPPAQGIQHRLDREPCDLIVMGSHGRRGLSRFFLGSVAETTVRHARCSVAVVHGPRPA